MSYKIELIIPWTHTKFSVSLPAASPEEAEAEALNMFPNAFIIDCKPGCCHA